MRRLFLFAIALTLWAGVAFMLPSAARQDSFPKLHDNNLVQTRAAFRDGLYLGGLAAQRGEEPHISEGRWSTRQTASCLRLGMRKDMTKVLQFEQRAASCTIKAFFRFMPFGAR